MYRVKQLSAFLENRKGSLAMITQLLATLIIFLMFKRFLWKPVKEILARRSQAMTDELAQAQKTREDAEVYLDQARQEVERARDAGRQIVTDARVEADELREATLRDADAKARRRLDAAEAEIAQKERAMRDELQDEVADLAIMAAERLLREKVDEERDRAFVDDFLKGR